MRYTLHHGDNREVLRTMPSDSVDSIVTDPPYELGFMGKKWDSTGIAYDQTLWAECLRVLKPGGHLIAFGGTRTYHRMTCAIEDVGFEIRDCIQWIYGSGFPKSHNLDGDWHGFGTALKPANEPAVLARKPLSGTVADNVMTWGVGALNINWCRVEYDGKAPRGSGNKSDKSIFSQVQNSNGNGGNETSTLGRWPANVIFDEEAAQMLDEQSGERHGGGHARHNIGTPSVARGKFVPTVSHGYSDSGGASRFFYVAKASRSEREAGLDGMEVRKVESDFRQGGMANPRDTGNYAHRANHHPTVKPITLMRYLVRLVTPPGGVVLDPFMGSGSTGCAAMLEAMSFVGIELSAEYLEIARRRILHHANQNPMGL